MSAAQGPGNYHGTMSKAELEREAGGSIFNARGSETRQQVANTRYEGQQELDERQEEEEDDGYESAGASSRYSGEGEDYVTTTGGKWVWSEVTKKWEWEAAAYSGSSQTMGGGAATRQAEEEVGSTDSGWTILPNGTYVRQVASWSRTSSGSSQQAGGGGAGAGRQGYFETGIIGGRSSAGGSSSVGGNVAGVGGTTSSGWVLLANGTYVRRQQQSSSSSSTWGGTEGRRSDSSSRDLGTGSVLSPSEYGDQGSNTTGWVRQADGTMVRKSSSWASWSASNYEELDDDRLNEIQQQLNERAKTNIRRPPANVEPGFEDQYFRAHRSLNSRLAVL